MFGTVFLVVLKYPDSGNCLPPKDSKCLSKTCPAVQYILLQMLCQDNSYLALNKFTSFISLNLKRNCATELDIKKKYLVIQIFTAY